MAVVGVLEAPSLVDSRWDALVSRYGDPNDPLALTANDMMYAWRVEFDLLSGDAERDHILSYYPTDDYTDAVYKFWVAGGHFPDSAATVDPESGDAALALLAMDAVLWLDPSGPTVRSAYLNRAAAALFATDAVLWLDADAASGTQSLLSSVGGDLLATAELVLDPSGAIV